MEESQGLDALMPRGGGGGAGPGAAGGDDQLNCVANDDGVIDQEAVVWVFQYAAKGNREVRASRASRTPPLEPAPIPLTQPRPPPRFHIRAPPRSPAPSPPPLSPPPAPAVPALDKLAVAVAVAGSGVGAGARDFNGPLVPTPAFGQVSALSRLVDQGKAVERTHDTAVGRTDHALGGVGLPDEGDK